MGDEVPAIDIRGLKHFYSKKSPVLQGIDLYVKKGHIYGLLGPSGCGKTTLLKCVVGILKPKEGDVHVLGYKPGSVESKIPGSRVGYMPQELALFKEFSVSETLHYFGRIHNMKSKAIKDRMNFLLSFLDLPPPNRLVGQLSGGQQRRVSLATAMLHSPEILILDEPTVGVDPLLRERIWNHLVDIANVENTTIIITTHYIEEARSANSVGLMRAGKLLAQGPPDELISRYNQTSLETVFLYLCVKDSSTYPSMQNSTEVKKDWTEQVAVEAEDSSELNEDVPDVIMVDPQTDHHSDDVKPLLPNDMSQRPPIRRDYSMADEQAASCSSKVKSFCNSLPKGNRMRALVIKNANMQKRRIGFLVFQFLLPAIQITIYALSIGGTPKNLPVSVANLDKGVELPVYNYNVSFSEAFISQVNHDVINFKFYDSVEEAKNHVKDGSAWAAISFGPDFSNDSLARAISKDIDPSVINGSILTVWTDSTNEQISVTIKNEIILGYQNIFVGLKEQAKEKYNFTLPDFSSSAEIPITYGDPIYGSDSETFLDFVAPGIICTIIYFQAVGLTSLTLTVERKEGLYERSLVSGVTPVEVILGHIATEFVIMSIQTTVLLVFAFVVFNVYNVGPIVVIILFTILLGMTGMCLGFLISSLTSDEREASQLALGLVFPFLLISGILWPIQAMPTWLQDIAVALPLTLAVNGLRFVVGRGWDFTHYEVWSGFVISAAWMIALFLLSLIMTQLRRYK